MTQSTESFELPLAISPSRAGDFQQCPLLFRFRSIDRLPTAPSSAATRGTVVHAALESLYDLPAAQRTVQAAADLIEPSWSDLLTKEPEVAVVVEEEGLSAWLDRARELITTYFAMEDPQRLEPAAREVFVEADLHNGLTIRGFIDRLDVAPNGDVRIVDYKTGKSPAPAFAEKSLFQMRFYALVLWRRDGAIPKQLKLIYLANGRDLIEEPDAGILERTEDKILSTWQDIESSVAKKEFEPKKSKLCSWCDFQALCPAFGGTAPELPLMRIESA
ncbi:unannotated protein [freshwater metagenome]|uniref:Unannotated protein n=1 Tax=freshwater metagenome TaxID=449393 RepID=A0A6J7EMZ5_9ZZZZ|nr:Dna2/Cas4 domain-containing protein [Actinomycetota bacterium]